MAVGGMCEWCKEFVVEFCRATSQLMILRTLDCTSSRFLTLEGLYFCSNLVRSWQYKQSCPRGLALASRILECLEDTSWKFWPSHWPRITRSLPLPWPWEKSLDFDLVLAKDKATAKAKTFLPWLGHVVALRVCSAHTHGVTWMTVCHSCLGMFHRLACKLDVSCKIIWVWNASYCMMPMHIRSSLST